MTINGTSGVNTGVSAGQTGMSQANDPVSKNIQSQIDNVQKQLQELSANTELSAEAKMKKRQELQKQISDLNNQLRQHQIEQRKEKQQNKEQSSFDDLLGTNPEGKGAKGKGQANGISQANMQAMISADTSMKQAQVQGSVATKMEGRAGVLEAEIKLDSARNGNVDSKKAELAEVEEKAMDATASQMNTLAEANKAMQEAAEADRTEEKKQEDEEEKTEDGQTEENTLPSEAENAAAGDVPGLPPVVHYTPVDVRL